MTKRKPIDLGSALYQQLAAETLDAQGDAVRLQRILSDVQSLVTERERNTISAMGSQASPR